MKDVAFDHVGIVVSNLEMTKAFVRTVFGLVIDREFVVPERGVKGVFFSCGNARIEFIEPTDSGVRAARLGDAKARIEHIAVRVADLPGTISELAASEIETTPLDAFRTVWTLPETTGGVMYQLLEGDKQ